MPTYTVVGLQDGAELFVSAVFRGSLRNSDRDERTDVYGTQMERFVGWFIARDADDAEAMAQEAVAWPFSNPDERTYGRDVTTIKLQGEIL